MITSIKTRFAPSPTGMLHIGGMRTAIFNWLYAKKHCGNFYLRIEDTDKERSYIKYLNSIKLALNWLGLYYNKKIIYQSNNIEKHLKAIEKLIIQRKAYYCYATQNEIQDFKKKYPGKKFISKWRESITFNKKKSSGVVRLKIENSGSTILDDKVLGKIEINNSRINDIVLLRSNNTPTYHISCVLDDYDVGITHVIRGNDHITNTFIQLQILKALNLKAPIFAHIPLIHNSNDNKISKRDGNLGIGQYNRLGYLSKAVLNYLLQLGWSYGDKEIISIEKAIEIFNFKNLNKSSSKFNVNKLKFINRQYIKNLDNQRIFQELVKKISKKTISCKYLTMIRKSIFLVKFRGDTMNDLTNLVLIFISYVNPIDKESKIVISSKKSLQLLKKIFHILKDQIEWKSEVIKENCCNFGQQLNISLPQIMKLLRACVLGTFKSPPIYKTLEIISRKEVLRRIYQVIK